MDKPRLLDLFCGAGGAAMGYYRAGFEVVGVDIKPQPHYPFEFHQADALTYPLEGFDAYHASPPCQYYSRLRHLPWMKDRKYWRSVPPTLAYLKPIAAPWVIENVEDCFDLPESIILCGQMFDLPIFRHRRFESNILILQPPHQKHNGYLAHGENSMAKRYAVSHVGVKEICHDSVCGHFAGKQSAAEAMDIDWMTGDELSQAIPPAYTEYVGKYLMKAVKRIETETAPMRIE